MRSVLMVVMTTLALVNLAGCASERESLERERTGLIQERQQHSDFVTRIPSGSRWADHPDTNNLMNRMGTIDSRVDQIDRSLGR